MEPSTLKIYNYSSDTWWKPLSTTGVNETGKYVWGSLASTQENSTCTFGVGFAKNIELAPEPTVISELYWYILAPYIVSASIVLIALVATVVYFKHVKRKVKP